MNALKQTLTVLGSTGSIGVNTLDVVARHPDQFQVFALTGAKQVDLMLSQCAKFRPQFAVMVNEDAAHALRERLLADGAEPVGNTPEQFGAFIKSEIDKWGKVIKAAGLKAE